MLQKQIQYCNSKIQVIYFFSGGICLSVYVNLQYADLLIQIPQKGSEFPISMKYVVLYCDDRLKHIRDSGNMSNWRCSGFGAGKSDAIAGTARSRIKKIAPIRYISLIHYHFSSVRSPDISMRKERTSRFRACIVASCCAICHCVYIVCA